jgi:hypothetical protein
MPSLCRGTLHTVSRSACCHRSRWVATAPMDCVHVIEATMNPNRSAQKPAISILRTDMLSISCISCTSDITFWCTYRITVLAFECIEGRHI